MPIGHAEFGEAATRRDEQEGPAPGAVRARSQSGGEAERRRPVAMCGREDLVQRAQGQARAGQVTVDLRQTERKMGRGSSDRPALQPRHGPS